MFHTYRARIIFYNILLIIFLISILGYTYFYSRNVIIEEAEIHSLNLSKLLRSNVEIEEEKLLSYTEIVRDDIVIQEYMFITAKVNSEKKTLQDLYQRNFGWLPIDRTVFINNDGKAIIGMEHEDLVQAINHKVGNDSEGIFYYQGRKNFELVTWARIYFQGVARGIVALTHPIDRGWLKHHQFFGGHYLLIGDDGKIALSDLPGAEGMPFQPVKGLITSRGKLYRVHPIPLTDENESNYRLWLAISEQALLDKLSRHSNLILFLMISGGLAMLITGLLMVRNFNHPLKELMQITRAVTEGELPKLKKSSETNEINALANRFAEMLTALRNKQAEIDRVQQQLQENAITDTLTGLYNRRHLNNLFPKLLAQVRRERKWLCALLLDLDNFKRINDEYGHPVGDQCLSHASELLRTSSRASDYLFRIGGEEFLILSISDATDGAIVLAEKIRQSFEKQNCSIGDIEIIMTTSIGVSCADDGRPVKDAMDNLLLQADKALYQAKAKGRNRVIAFSETTDTSSEKE